MIDKVKQGGANRMKGARFELKVRKDLESKGWIVDKWTNNVTDGKLHPSRSFRGITRQNGFPDFIAFKFSGECLEDDNTEIKEYEVIGVEVKTNGFLRKEEKEKCACYLDNNVFSKILIASKGDKEIVYKEFERRLKK